MVDNNKAIIVSQYIDKIAELSHWLDQLNNVFHHRSEQGMPNWIALDTEFVREKTYFPQLCLIQVAYPDLHNQPHLACIDPIAIDDLSALGQLLKDTKITKVFHAAYQDQEILFQRFGYTPAPLFDTQPAAAILGVGDQVGYARLVESLLNVVLEKSQSRTDWSRRPLTKKQLEYAIDDVRYLFQIYPLIVQKLASERRLAWLDSEFEVLSDPQTYTPNPEAMWKKVKGVQTLKGRQLSVLQGLAAWREQLAIQKNRPKRWIVSDEVLLDLSRLMPSNPVDMQQIRGFDENALRQHASNVLSIIEHYKQRPKEQWPQLSIRKKPEKHEEELIDLLMLVVRYQANRHQIVPSVIAGRKKVEKMVMNKETQLTQDWRGSLVNEQFAAVMSGHLQVKVESGKVVLLTSEPLV